MNYSAALGGLIAFPGVVRFGYKLAVATAAVDGCRQLSLYYFIFKIIMNVPIDDSRALGKTVEFG